MNAPISEDDLHAWVDGRLPPQRRAEVETWLAAHPEARARLEAWRAQDAALHRAFDGVLDEPVPTRLVRAAAAPHLLVRRAAAAFGWLALGSVLGFTLGRDGAPLSGDELATSLPRYAAIAHAVYAPEQRHPVEVGAEQEAHLVAWLSKRLGAELRAPRLDAAGYRLVGGRLLPGEAGAVAQLMYEDATGRRLTLYVRRDGAERADTAFRVAQEGALGVFYWIDGRFGYALSGELPRDELLRVGTLVYRQVEGG